MSRPFRAALYFSFIPRALPWAKEFGAFGTVWKSAHVLCLVLRRLPTKKQSQISDLKFQIQNNVGETPTATRGTRVLPDADVERAQRTPKIFNS
jgi:hypothetical protein